MTRLKPLNPPQELKGVQNLAWRAFSEGQQYATGPTGLDGGMPSTLVAIHDVGARPNAAASAKVRERWLHGGQGVPDTRTEKSRRKDSGDQSMRTGGRLFQFGRDPRVCRRRKMRSGWDFGTLREKISASGTRKMRCFGPNLRAFAAAGGTEEKMQT